MGEIETRNVGGGLGGIGGHTLPEDNYNIKQLQYKTLLLKNFKVSPSHLVELISAGVVSLRAGTLSTKLSNPEQRLASTEAAAATTCGRNDYNTSMDKF